MNKLIFLFLPLLFLSTACTQNQTDSLIFEPAGSADYYINNQTSSDLSVLFTTSAALGFEKDSVVVAENSSQKILDDGIFGINPRPEDSFSSISFYKPGDTDEPAFIFEPVTNDEWEIIGSELEETGYGLTEFELTLTDSTLAGSGS